MALFQIPKYAERQPFGYSQDGWRIDYRMGRDVDGALVIKELHIRPDYSSLASVALRLPRGGITQLGVLRRLQLDESRRYGALVLETQSIDPVKPQPRAKRTTGRKRGRPLEIPIAQYRRVAARWNELIDKKATHPAKQLAKEFGMPHARMRQWLYRYDRMAAADPAGLVPRMGTRRRPTRR